jgi:geranylgeranyl diphosphate synthase type II
MNANDPATSDPHAVAEAEAFLDAARARIEGTLHEVLPPTEGPGSRLAEAMAYSVLAGGKRLRPALALAACRAVGGDEERVLPFGAALELIHTYSLIHDDLPAMDDDDLRRGRPTSHKVYGEALAILAGDALHTLAFEVLLARTEPAALARRAAVELARAAGARGMVGGQVEDLGAAGSKPDEERLLLIQGGKTAALLRAACRGGALLGGGDEDQVEAAGRYGRHLGFAFQMVDDVLDVTGTAETLGKTPGKDVAEHRMTWVALEGVDGTMARAEREIGWALEAIRDLPGRTLLAGLARYVTRRDR